MLSKRKNGVKSYRLTAVFWREGRQVVGKCPELGVSSCGDDWEDAKQMLEEAVNLYIHHAKKLGMLEELKHVLNTQDRYATFIEVPA